MKKIMIFFCLVITSVCFSVQAEITETKPFGPLTLPYVVKGACPFECCTYREWTAETVIPVYKTELESQPKKILLQLKPGNKFRAVTGNVHIIQPGQVVLDQDFEVFKKGETAQILDEVGEGYFHAWYKNSILTIFAFWESSSMTLGKDYIKGKLVQESLKEWWVQIVTQDGKKGWIKMDQTIKVNGADACG